MMTTHQRMSPLTAFFLGLFGVGGATIAATAGIVLYGMSIVEKNAEFVTSFVDNTMQELPELIERLPALADAVGGQRTPHYTENLEIDVKFVADERYKGIRPVMTIVNRGSEVVSMLAVRVAALTEDHIPVSEWTEVVATPFAVDDNEWRGPLLPGGTRYVRLSLQGRGIELESAESLLAAVEISEVRLWQPTNAF